MLAYLYKVDYCLQGGNQICSTTADIIECIKKVKKTEIVYSFRKFTTSTKEYNPTKGDKNAADKVEEMSDTGFIDDRHIELYNELEEASETGDFKQFQQAASTLRHYVDSQKETLPGYEAWRARDDEFISDFRRDLFEASYDEQDLTTDVTGKRKDTDIIEQISSEEISEKKIKQNYQDTVSDTVSKDNNKSGSDTETEDKSTPTQEKETEEITQIFDDIDLF